MAWLRKKPGNMLVNIRVGSWHLMSGRRGLSVVHNPHHARLREWWPPKFTKAEFRAKPDWQWFAVNRFFGLEARK